MSIETLANLNRADWQRIASRVPARPETRRFVDGAYADAVGGARFEGVNPVTRETVAAGVRTREIRRAHRLIRDSQAGVNGFNKLDEGDMTQACRGCRQFGNARDKCVGSLLSYAQTRSAWIRLG
ncbi:MAG: hypothetical protein OEW35_08655 [Gammaproteobacteria bacterium]|nr:hypothetical protein [Gammaproteobacteria bacterium]MDH4255871.1 hypothetical protein [Gammaproteobacteria bacterium]MDH5310653.1 hypothetical protein [Gammaproteobacteria bacterium]